MILAITVDEHDRRVSELIEANNREVERRRAAEAEVERLTKLLNTPAIGDFLEGAAREAAHQIERWGEAHDRNKAPADWFWLVGYLAGKALHAHIAGDAEKAMHHTISSAAALAHWHRCIILGDAAP